MWVEPVKRSSLERPVGAMSCIGGLAGLAAVLNDDTVSGSPGCSSGPGEQSVIVHREHHSL